MISDHNGEAGEVSQMQQLNAFWAISLSFSTDLLFYAWGHNLGPPPQKKKITPFDSPGVPKELGHKINHIQNSVI